MDKNEFDSDFDFEKEYGFSLESIMGSDDEDGEEYLLDSEDDATEADQEAPAFEEEAPSDEEDYLSSSDGEADGDFDFRSFAALGLEDDASETEADAHPDDPDDLDLDALSLELDADDDTGPMEEMGVLEFPAAPSEEDEPDFQDFEEEPKKKKRSLFAWLGFGRSASKERRVRPRIEYEPEDQPQDEEISIHGTPDFPFEEPDPALTLEADFQDEPEVPVEIREFTPEPAFPAEPELELPEELLLPETDVQLPSVEAPEPAADTADGSVDVDIPIARTREPAGASQDAPRRPRRRKKRSKMRIIKDVYLPPLFAGITVILILTIVIGSITQAVQRSKLQAELDKNAAASSQNEAVRLQEEAQDLLSEAASLAAIYDYEGAIAKLDSFSGDISSFTDLVNKRQDYAMAQDTLVEWIDPSAIPNLSFHVLIADPARAFSDTENGAAYNMNFVTIDEFSAILEQLYKNNYVLVDMDCFVEETASEDGRTTYTSKPLYLPQGKKPIMLTETLVNYFGYMIDGDDDGTPDAKGGGFASRLVLDANGKIAAEMVDTNGDTVIGDYDLVPILNKFIEEHDGFSYRGSKATLAVCGYEGIFGYRVQKSTISSKGQAYYDEQVIGAKAVLQALREDGYEIACYTYNNISYGEFSATDIHADLLKWNDEIAPIIGELDTLVYARGSDISDISTAYSESKYNVLYNAGFRYFIGSSEQEAVVKINNDHVRQVRLMVTGQGMTTRPAIYASYFDAASVLNDQRGA